MRTLSALLLAAGLALGCGGSATEAEEPKTETTEETAPAEETPAEEMGTETPAEETPAEETDAPAEEETDDGGAADEEMP